MSSVLRKMPVRPDTAMRGVHKRTETQGTEALPHTQIEEILHDYRLAYLSRTLSIVGRREVLQGNAKFGIFGDGKELAQVAMARVFRPGDFRSGYYRDQTFMLATGMITLAQFFAQLFAHGETQAEPASGGRSMVAHFGSRLVDEQGRWRNQMETGNTSADISPTAGQMPRLVGLAYASRLYRELSELKEFSNFSCAGNEVAFGTIGNAACAEGHFWEALNAIGVLQVPAVISIWDDNYGISVPNRLQFSTGNISTLLRGFRRARNDAQGFDLYTVPGWDYPRLLRVYRRAALSARRNHVPAVIHVTEMVQPLGHSTSGSHERYKSSARLAWEAAHDPLDHMRAWILKHKIATDEVLGALERDAGQEVEEECRMALQARNEPLQAEAAELVELLTEAAARSPHADQITKLIWTLDPREKPERRQMLAVARRALTLLGDGAAEADASLAMWRQRALAANQQRYGSHLYSQSDLSALQVPIVSAIYAGIPEKVRGFELLRANFDALLDGDARRFILGEDVGMLGGVNQALSGLQEKYGPLRVSDTGIRETTIVGQAIGMALRGLRPIAEIQYIDYILYALTTLSDDLATLHWRTRGGQKAPVIIRTRGHRLEGIWHSGSPMAMLLNSLRGIHILVPRDMTRAAGFYNTLLQADDPALVVEVLNGYRLREPLPINLGEFTLPLGVPEILRRGNDVTLVTYGATCRVALEAAEELQTNGIQVEVIDVQSLLPFDIRHSIVESLQKTGRLLLVDEDLPGGASAYMMQQVLEVQGGYRWLDSAPTTVTGQPHRPAYGSDGDYFSKPNMDDIFVAVYELMREAQPRKFPNLFGGKDDQNSNYTGDGKASSHSRQR